MQNKVLGIATADQFLEDELLGVGNHVVGFFVESLLHAVVTHPRMLYDFF